MAKTVNLEKLKEDMERWPRAWAGFGSDIPTGKQIVQAILPFLLAMVEAQLTLRTQRASDRKVKQGNCNRWERREELEYGVTDNYSVWLYLNTAAQSYRDLSQNPPSDVSRFDFEGISIENRYMVLNPTEHAVDLTLCLEPRFSGDAGPLSFEF
jgi:hypothetical protein